MTFTATGPAAKPGLLRMIVVNTHRMKNRIEELPFDAHTAIIARNQAGKTSLMKLLPFFWGSLMREVLPPSVEKKGFIEFYLPTDASYLACEYINAHGDVRTVIVHTDPSKTSIQYRLIRGGISPSELFLVRTADGETGFVKNMDFESHARRLGYDINSRLITSTKDYRGIIQGRIPSGTTYDRQAFSGLIEEFGIGRRSAPLDNVDRLFLTMLDNNFSITDLLSIVTNKVVDFSSLKLSILGGANSPESLSIAEDFRSYRKIMAKEPLLREAEAAETHRAVFEAEINSLRSRLLGALSEADARIEALQGEVTQTNEQFRKSEDEINLRIQAETETHAAMTGEIKALVEQIKRIDAAQVDLIAAGADTAQSKLAIKARLQNEVETIRQQIEAITGGREKLEARFSKIVDKIREDARVQLMQIDDQLIALPAKMAQIKAGHASDLEAYLKDVRLGHSAILSEIEGSLRSMRKKRDDVIDVLSRIEADPDLVMAHERQKDRITSATADIERIRDKLAKSSQQSVHAEKTAREASAKTVGARQAVESIERRLAQVQKQREPVHGSLRHWLEGKRPDWRDTIGKVIDETLLDRTDLSPVEADGSSLFGVEISVNRLTGGCASLESLERDQARLFADLGTAQNELKISEDQERSAGTARQKAIRAADEDAAMLQVLENSLKSARESEKEARSKVDASRLGLRAQALEARAALDETIGDIEQRHKEALTEAEASIDAVRAEWGLREQAALSPLIDQQASLNSVKQSINLSRDKDVASVLDKMGEALLAEGSDPEKMRLLSGEEQSCLAQLKLLAGVEVLAERWARFTNEDLPACTAAKDRARLLRQGMEAAAGTIKTLKDQLVERRAESRKQIDEISARLDMMKGLRLRADLALKADGNAQAVDPVACDPAGIDDLVEDIDNRKQQSRKALSDIAAATQKLRQAFMSANGKIRDSFIARARKLENAAEGPRWLSIYSDWFDTGHVVIRSQITDLLPIICSPIIKSHKDMTDFDEQISRVSRQLRAAIADLAQFPGITEVHISVRSKIKLEAFWSDLESFVTTWREWNRHQDQMELDQLIDALETLLKNWPQGATPEIDLRDMIYIDGQLREGMDLRKITRDTDLGKLSSEGGSSILRLIILTASIHLIRGKSDVRFTWCVDEFGRLDRSNSRHLLEMLTNNGITLVTGAPSLDAGIRGAFANRISIHLMPESGSSTLFTVDRSGKTRSGVRERDEDGNLIHIEEII